MLALTEMEPKAKIEVRGSHSVALGEVLSSLVQSMCETAVNEMIYDLTIKKVGPK